jgi:pilus assembly protein FimV
MTVAQFKHRGVHVLAAMALMALCGASQGLGLGQAVGRPVNMGEGLSFEAPLRLAPGEQVDADCLSADVYFGDDKVAGFKVAVSLSQDRQGAPSVHVATASRVNEPVVTVYVVAGCMSHVTRKYVVLADPPGLPMPAEPALAGVPLIAPAIVAAPVAARPAKHVAPTRTSRLKATQVTAAARLQIDPVAADALVVPTLRMGTRLSLPSDWQADAPAVHARRAAAAAYWRALQTAPENWAQDQERLAELAQRVVALQSLRDQMASARQASAVAPAASAAAPRFSRNEEEVQRIRAVGLIGVALFGVVAWGRMRWREREASGEAPPNWWQGWQEGGPASAAQLAPVLTMPSPDGADTLNALEDDALPGPTVEVLIDLAQQVELFVVLGQDDAAQALLEDHVRRPVGRSPMPFLMLLALHHRRHQRPGYERTRRAMDARFHGHAPSWADAEQLQGQPLADMPKVWREVQAARAQPDQARALLAQLIGQPPQAGAERLGLLAYQDLMSAYNDPAPATAARIDVGAPVDLARAAHQPQPEPGGIALSC